MDEIFIIIFGLPILSVFVFFSIRYLIKSTKEISKKLDDVEYEAKEAETIIELEKAWENLKEVNKDCWHRTFGSKVTIIKTIIVTKHRMLTK
jgi:hypothetical protein